MSQCANIMKRLTTTRGYTILKARAGGEQFLGKFSGGMAKIFLISQVKPVVGVFPNLNRGFL